MSSSSDRLAEVVQRQMLGPGLVMLWVLGHVVRVVATHGVVDDQLVLVPAPQQGPAQRSLLALIGRC